MLRSLFIVAFALAFPALADAFQYLKQSTAKTVVMGPFVDSTDGATAETGLTLSQADIRLSKSGAAFAQTNNAAGATHMENGYYSVPLDTTDTNTLGTLVVAVSESGALPTRRDFFVVPANVFDSLASTDNLQVDVVQVKGEDASGILHGYSTITYVETSDNLETIAEAAASGTLLVLQPGTHTITAEITLPSGVDVAGTPQTLVTGDPGNGANTIFRCNGRNTFSDFRIQATTDGSCIGTTSSGTASHVTCRRMVKW